MHLRWILVVVLVCAEAEVQVKGGLCQNAVMRCYVNTSNVLWYVESSGTEKRLIARTFSLDPDETDYPGNATFKYIAMGTKLVITSITAEDYRLYFCADKQGSSFVDTIRLVPDLCVAPCTNDSESGGWRSESRRWQSPVVYGSLVLNGVLVSVIVGLVAARYLKRKTCHQQPAYEAPPLTADTPGTLETPQYEEIQIQTPPPAAAPPPECIYYKAQLPGSSWPRHH